MKTRLTSKLHNATHEERLRILGVESLVQDFVDYLFDKDV